MNSLPETANLGLLTYGMRVSNAPEDHERGCQDIETLVPVNKLDRTLLNAKIDEMTPQGYTPIGNSLRAAAKELGDDGQRTIILVSDGIDTCAPPPVCEVAKELAGEGFDLTIHTVGFKTDDEARHELECIASVAGGDFLEADDTASLAKSLKFLSQRDASLYETTGTEFEYSDTPAGAKWLGEGRYRTRVDVPLRKSHAQDMPSHYFKLAIPDGHRAIVSTAIIPQRTATGRARAANLHLIGDDLENSNENCHAVLAANGGVGSTMGSGYLPPTPGVRIIDPEEGGEDCDPQEWIVPTEFWLFRGVQDEETAGSVADVEVEINFEPILDDAEVAPYPAPAEKKLENDGPALEFNDATAVKGGASFAEAIEVKPGVYSDAIVPGEYRFYKFPVEYGQRPVVNFRTGKSERAAADSLSAVLYSPLRAEAGRDALVFYEDEESGAVAGDVVNYRNRERDWRDTSGAQAGFYYVGVSMEQGRKDDIMGVEQPFEIAFDAVGNKTDGPGWRPTDQNGPEPSDSPPGERASRPVNESDVTESFQAKDDSADGGMNRTGMVTLFSAGLVVLVVALAATVVRLRRK